LLSETDFHPAAARIFTVVLVPNESVPAVAAAVRPSPDATPEWNPAADAEAAVRPVVRDAEADFLDATIFKFDAYLATVTYVVPLEAVGDGNDDVVAVTGRAVLSFDTRPRLAERDVSNSVPRNKKRRISTSLDTGSAVFTAARQSRR
jgi:hypothetical protein